MVHDQKQMEKHLSQKQKKTAERSRLLMKAKEMTDLIRDFTQFLEVSPTPGTYAALQEEAEKNNSNIAE